MLDMPKPAMKDVPSVVRGTQDPGIVRAGKPSTKHRRVLLLAFVLAMVAAAGASAWALLLRPINVTVSHPESNVAVQVFGLGTVEARVTSKVGFKVSGVLVDLRADVGDRVRQGRDAGAPR